MWNRDVNCATNIYKITKNSILQKPRPKYLCREGNKKNNVIEDKKMISAKIKVNKGIKNKNSVTVHALV